MTRKRGVTPLVIAPGRDALTRSAGILLHPTSLPGPYGIGSLGADARRFVDFLTASGMGLWQTLPLGPNGYADSPYAGLSAFAGNPLLIDLDLLQRENLIDAHDLDNFPEAGPSSVDFGRTIPAKTAMLRRACQKFVRGREGPQAALEAYVASNRAWLEDYALFMALKDAHSSVAWDVWDPGVRKRDPKALEQARVELAAGIEFHRFTQFVFDQQWTALRTYAHDRGISIVGDMPIFVAYDSADVWSGQDQFRLDADGRPEFVAGVPPDYFSATGQLWGNPHYRWERMAKAGFSWWVERFRALLKRVDIIRLDHFRGFAAAWWVPYGSETAEAGTWVRSPGAEIFTAAQAALGEIPIIAEDLGLITPDVVELRDRFGFPGMKILQFAFDKDLDSTSLPHNFTRNTCVYTGTHDNDTTIGWFKNLSRSEHTRVCRYLNTPGTDIAWDLMRLGFASVAERALAPMQDILRLGSEARMNRPGTVEGNWQWRFSWGQVSSTLSADLRSLAETYGR